MADYALLQQDDDNVGTTDLSVEFTTDSLDAIAEQFYWFIKRAGFDYITAVCFAGKEGGIIAEFPAEGEL